jgi:uncharacterized protein (TIGR02118 family)
MVKLVFCCRRRPEYSPEEFYERWLDVHGPLVRSLREKLPGMRRYVQSHTVGDDVNAVLRASRNAAEPYDGITEVWFDDLDSLGVTSEEAIAAGRQLLEDEAKFLDLPRCSLFLTEEHEIF